MKNIPETIMDNASLSTLVTALKAAELVDTLSGAGPFTVLAPTNDAFAKIPSDKLSELLADKAKLASVLTYHVLPGKMMAKEIMSMKEGTTVQGGKITIDSTHGVKINTATVVATDIESSNGVIHTIDTVLMP